MFPSLLPCHSIDYRGRKLLNGPFLVYVFFLFSPKSALFPTSRLPLLRVFLRSLTSSPPSPFPSPFPSSSQFPYSLLLSFPSPPLSSFHSCVSPWVSTPSPVPAPSPLPFPSISCVRCSPLPLFSFLLRPRSHHRSRHRSRPNRCSPRPCFRLRSRPRLLSPPPAPFVHSCLLDPVTPSVRCACTGTGPCEWSCRVPASATPCL